MKLENFKDPRERLRKHGARPPLRTLQEMAEEFGVNAGTLKNLIQFGDGPKAALIHPGSFSSSRTVWYEPKALRAWWAALPKK